MQELKKAKILVCDQTLRLMQQEEIDKQALDLAEKLKKRRQRKKGLTPEEEKDEEAL